MLGNYLHQSFCTQVSVCACVCGYVCVCVWFKGNIKPRHQTDRIKLIFTESLFQRFLRPKHHTITHTKDHQLLSHIMKRNKHHEVFICHASKLFVLTVCLFVWISFSERIQSDFTGCLYLFLEMFTQPLACCQMNAWHWSFFYSKQLKA